METRPSWLEWRYATKKFDPSKKLSDAQVRGLMEALRLAPSSYGLQPWKFIIVTDPILRKELRTHAWNQPQITDASLLIVLCALKKMDENYVKRFIQTIAKTRDVEARSLKSYEDMMTGSIKNRTPEALSNWMKHQLYIALGFLLSECANQKIDACPMEGFDPKKFDEILKLDAQGLESVVLCAVGTRSADDGTAGLKKVRFCSEEIFIKR